MFSKWPPPSRPEDIPALVRKLADGFVKEARKSSGLNLTSEKYDIEEFTGDHCKGSCAAFEFKSGDTNRVQALFVMSVDGQTWNGQFTGKPDDWRDALKLLKTVKKRG